MIFEQQCLELFVLEFFSFRATELIGITIRENINIISFLDLPFVVGKALRLLSYKFADREFIAGNFYHFVVTDNPQRVIGTGKFHRGFFVIDAAHGNVHSIAHRSFFGVLV